MREGAGRWHVIGDTHQHHAERLLSELSADLFRTLPAFHWHLLSGQGEQSPIYQRAVKQARGHVAPEQLHLTPLLAPITAGEEGLDILPVIDTLLTQIRKHPKTVLLIQGVDEWVYLGVPLSNILIQLRRLRAALREGLLVLHLYGREEKDEPLTQFLNYVIHEAAGVFSTEDLLLHRQGNEHCQFVSARAHFATESEPRMPMSVIL